jgi:serine-type D-Ala-D-Ala carboxypeptidase (penicillin-binding protein 5/6)
MPCRWVKSFVLASACALAFACSAVAAPPQLDDARAYLVVNGATGETLVAHNARSPVPIASITKLMTAIVALQHLQPDDVVTVTTSAARVGESSIPLRSGQRISVRDLLEAALIQSANNAAVALGAAAAGGDVSRFVGWMNTRARQLGLRDTHFVRPDGLDVPGHVSSARDVSVLARVAMRSPVIRQIVARRTDTIEDGAFTVHTWNDLLGVFPGLIGVKTGHTDDAGWCQVAAARRPGYTIYAVVLGSPTRRQRNDDLQQLLAYGVSQYRTLQLVRPRTYAWAAAPYGRDRVPLVAGEPLRAVVRVGRPLVEKIVAPTAVSLPVRKGQALGRVEIWRAGRLIGSRSLHAAISLEKPGTFDRVGWYAGRTMHNLVGLLH